MGGGEREHYAFQKGQMHNYKVEKKRKKTLIAKQRNTRGTDLETEKQKKWKVGTELVTS